MPRIEITVSAEDQVDGDLVSSLITTSLTGHGFDDVTNISNAHSYKTDEDALAAMRNLNPAIFSSEITIGVTEYEQQSPNLGPDDGQPGDEQFPPPDDEDDGD